MAARHNVFTFMRGMHSKKKTLNIPKKTWGTSEEKKHYSIVCKVASGEEYVSVVLYKIPSDTLD